MIPNEIIHSQCRSCAKSTRHLVLFCHVHETDPEYYHEKDSWGVIRCEGCWTVSFQYRNDDFEQVYEDSEGNIEHVVVINSYPRGVPDHKPLGGTYWLPELIRKVYKQTLSAYGEKAYVLASIGLRATIEAVCNHLKVSGTNLEKRIDQLFKGGHVSNGDKKRLHAIRFLGNDAAHEVKEPSASDLKVALDIVEHLLNSVFILEHNARSLKTVIEEYPEFEKLIGICAKSADATQALSIGALLGTNRRLVGNNIDIFEKTLIDGIKAGSVGFLLLDGQQKINGKDVQFYKIGDTSQIIDFDDIPF
jgi:hypothetical protein